MKTALWENTARRARTEAIPQLSAILPDSVSSEDFTTRDDVDAHMQLYRSMSFDELRYRATDRDAVLARLRDIPALGSTRETRLFFARSSVLGGLRVPRTPPPQTLLQLLDWDGDDVFVFDVAERLHIHLDLGEGWLTPEQFGVAPREMLIIIRTPMT
jgi:hypothetical protein